jgi:hypothetical protein
MDPFEDTVNDTLETTKIISNTDKPGFIEHVFKFDNETKSTLLNLLQYTVLAIIPITILIKLLGNYVPPPDDTKNNFEITLEIILQVGVIITGIFYIHRLITYIPMYSGVNISSINFVNIILGFLVLLLTMQSKLGNKVQILTDRVLEFVYGEEYATTNTNTNNSNNGETQNQNIINIRQPLRMEPPPQPVQREPPLPIPKQVGFSDDTHYTHGSDGGNMFNNRQNMSNMNQGQPKELMAANEIGGSFAAW